MTPRRQFMSEFKALGVLKRLSGTKSSAE